MTTATVTWLLVQGGDPPPSGGWLAGAEPTTLADLLPPERRTEWLLGRWAAKRLLADRLADGDAGPSLAEIEIRPAPDGAPEPLLGGSPVPATLSISHRTSCALAMVAPADTLLGCDLELIEPRGDRFVRDSFTEAEIAAIERAPQLLHPLLANLLWSAKESALKALRQGLTRDTRRVEVTLRDLHRLEGWSALAVRDRDSGRALTGWWRTRGSHLLTCVTDRECPPPRRAGPRAPAGPCDRAPA